MQTDMLTYTLGPNTIDWVEKETGWERARLERLMNRAADRNEACVIRIAKRERVES